MNQTNETKPQRSGFRFSLTDAAVLLIAIALTLWLRTNEIPLWWLPLAVLTHFFLFCNVFLVWRKYELIWAFLFVLNTGIHIILGELDWLSPLVFQLPVTITIILLQIRSPHYRGIFAHR